jgi:hypothetical protein
MLGAPGLDAGLAWRQVQTLAVRTRNSNLSQLTCAPLHPIHAPNIHPRPIRAAFLRVPARKPFARPKRTRMSNVQPRAKIHTPNTHSGDHAQPHTPSTQPFKPHSRVQQQRFTPAGLHSRLIHESALAHSTPIHTPDAHALQPTFMAAACGTSTAACGTSRGTSEGISRGTSGATSIGTSGEQTEGYAEGQAEGQANTSVPLECQGRRACAVEPAVAVADTGGHRRLAAVEIARVQD